MRRLLTCLAAAAVTCGGLAASAPPAAAADPASGSFSTLTYNVAGPAVGHLQRLDAARHQHHGHRPTPRPVRHRARGGGLQLPRLPLRRRHRHPYRTPTSGGAGIGSGLNTLSNLPYDADDFERVHWNSCQLDSGDCLTPKGFTFMRERLAEGVYVDFYNLHTNAGTNAGDLASRADNLNQLTAFIKTHSAGNAVVVMGDTNTRYTRSGDTIAEFAAGQRPHRRLGAAASAAAPRPPRAPTPCVCDQTAPPSPTPARSSTRSSTAAADSSHSTPPRTTTSTPSSSPTAASCSPTTTRSPSASPGRRNPAYQLSDQFGGPHGDYFNDIDACRPTPGRQPVAALGARVDQHRASPSQRHRPHPRRHRRHRVLADARQRASTSPPHTCARAEKDGHTRIFYAKFTTNLGRTLAGGTTPPTASPAPRPRAGRSPASTAAPADELDKIGFVYTKH